MKADVVSVDSGSSYTKIFAGNAETRVKIPTREIALSKLTREAEAEAIEYEGRFYLVGHDALANELRANLDPRIDDKFHGGQSQLIHLCYLLEKIDLHEGTPSTLIRSLPYADTHNAALVNAIKSQRQFTWSCGGKKRQVTFGEVHVIAQGTAPLADLNILHNPDFPVVACADIGSCTTDVPVLVFHREKKRHVYNETVSFSNREFNTNRFIRDMRAKFKNEPGCGDRDFSYSELSQMLEDDRFRIVNGSTAHDDKTLRPIVNGLKKTFTEDFVELMKKSLTPETWAKVNKLGICGGGAHLIERSEWPCSERSVFMDEWSTVEAQFRAFS